MFSSSLIAVIVAYRMLSWIGVSLYLFGWVLLASRIGVIDVGWLPILVSIIPLLLYDILRRS
jgi:hypothetical protein